MRPRPTAESRATFATSSDRPEPGRSGRGNVRGHFVGGTYASRSCPVRPIFGPRREKSASATKPLGRRGVTRGLVFGWHPAHRPGRGILPTCAQCQTPREQKFPVDATVGPCALHDRTFSGPGLPHPPGPELDADPRADRPPGLGHRVLPRPLATSSHHQKIACRQHEATSHASAARAKKEAACRAQ